MKLMEVQDSQESISSEDIQAELYKKSDSESAIVSSSQAHEERSDVTIEESGTRSAPQARLRRVQSAPKKNLRRKLLAKLPKAGALLMMREKMLRSATAEIRSLKMQIEELKKQTAGNADYNNNGNYYI